jgi:ABC-type glutathione transport system ATPase component
MRNNAEPNSLIELEGITKIFHTRGAPDFVAVQDVSLNIRPGEIVALVGESGSGKSTLGRIALGLIAADQGRVLLNGESLDQMSPEYLRSKRAMMQPIFQDPTSSLNPRRTVRELLAQALRLRKCDPEEESIRVLEQVGLRPGFDYLSRLPHELSGGQRQRLAIARAIATAPRLIIADEPLSGADVSIRGQVLNLLLDIREQQGVAYLMITHDISVARAFADRVAVMMRGRIVEIGDAATVLTRPQHAYTQRLIAAEPKILARNRATPSLAGV